jgi:hypothetical protein
VALRPDEGRDLFSRHVKGAPRVSQELTLARCAGRDAVEQKPVLLLLVHEVLSAEWIDPKFPQLSRRFARAMADRTAIERLHKLMKYDYGDERLTKRGNAAFQARLDKTLLAMHLVLAYC